MFNKQFSNLFSLTENPIFSALLNSIPKPNPVTLPDIVREVHITADGTIDPNKESNLELVFDPYTGNLKGAFIFTDDSNDAK